MNEETARRNLLADVAAMYYLKQMTQGEIADSLGLSRIKVHRLLKEARDENIVEITIHRALPRHDRFEEGLKERFGLREALVLDTAGLNEAETGRGLGEITASYLEGLLAPDSTIALCLGRSTYEVVQAIRPRLRSSVRVAQASGSISFAVRDLDSMTVVRQLANKLGGEVLYLPSPMVADSPEGAAVLRRQRDIERTLAAAASADLALLGIGNLDSFRTHLMSAAGLDPSEVEAMKQAGAIGDMAGQVITVEGKVYPSDLAERLIGLSLEDLRRIPIVIAVAFGLAKAAAILGALRTGAIDVLATDDGAAGEILRLEGAAHRKGDAGTARPFTHPL